MKKTKNPPSYNIWEYHRKMVDYQKWLEINKPFLYSTIEERIRIEELQRTVDGIILRAETQMEVLFEGDILDLSIVNACHIPAIQNIDFKERVRMTLFFERQKWVAFNHEIEITPHP